MVTDCHDFVSTEAEEALGDGAEGLAPLVGRQVRPLPVFAGLGEAEPLVPELEDALDLRLANVAVLVQPVVGLLHNCFTNRGALQI